MNVAHPAPTVDILIATEIDGDPAVVVIERRHEPVGMALPGGFVDVGETVAAAARREAQEETSLVVELVELFHVYSDPRRDARLHSISTVFIARPQTPMTELRGADDAKNARVVRVSELGPELVFDHAVIVSDYRRYLETGERPPPER